MKTRLALVTQVFTANGHFVRLLNTEDMVTNMLEPSSDPEATLPGKSTRSLQVLSSHPAKMTFSRKEASSLGVNRGETEGNGMEPRIPWGQRFDQHGSGPQPGDFPRLSLILSTCSTLSLLGGGLQPLEALP